MNFINDLINFPFIFYGFMTSIILALGFGIISPFIISKEQSFLPPAISHSALLGISLSLLIGATQTEVFFLTLLISTIIAFLLSYFINNNKLPPDVFIGIFLTITMASGILINEVFLNNQANLFHFLFGNILLISKQDYLITFTVVLISSVSILSLFKYWIFISYDPQSAKNQGIPVKLFQYLFSFILTMLVIASIKMTGIILVNALALIPGLFALKLSKNIKTILIYSTSFSILTTIIGFITASTFNLTTGVTIALVQFILLVIGISSKKLIGKYL